MAHTEAQSAECFVVIRSARNIYPQPVAGTCFQSYSTKPDSLTMCKCFDKNQKIQNEENPDQAFPQVLLALIRLERKAYKDFSAVEDDCKQVEEMQGILIRNFWDIDLKLI